jgi:deazaflavin-dependent oxidoreductase (nitroreductase family)
MSEKVPERPKPPLIPADMNEFNRGVIAEFRANGGGLSGPMAGRELMLLTTRGAQSGLERTAVVGYRRCGDVYVVIASGNGAFSHPAWYRNLLANPEATIEVGSERLDVRARTAVGEERERLAAIVEYLERQQKLTDREIPVVALEPIQP